MDGWDKWRRSVKKRKKKRGGTGERTEWLRCKGDLKARIGRIDPEGVW